MLPTDTIQRRGCIDPAIRQIKPSRFSSRWLTRITVSHATPAAPKTNAPSDISIGDLHFAAAVRALCQAGAPSGACAGATKFASSFGLSGWWR